MTIIISEKLFIFKVNKIICVSHKRIKFYYDLKSDHNHNQTLNCEYNCSSNENAVL